MGTSELFKLIMPLLIITIMLGGVLWFVKKYSLPGKGKINSGINLSVLTTYQLMPKKFLSVVKVEDKYLLLGISEHSVNLIQELDIDPDKLTPATTVNQMNFGDIFKKALKNK